MQCFWFDPKCEESPHCIIWSFSRASWIKMHALLCMPRTPAVAHLAGEAPIWSAVSPYFFAFLQRMETTRSFKCVRMQSDSRGAPMAHEAERRPWEPTCLHVVPATDDSRLKCRGDFANKYKHSTWSERRMLKRYLSHTKRRIVKARSFSKVIFSRPRIPQNNLY